MLHKISAFCDKIDSVKKLSDDLRVLKYNTKSKERDFKIQNLIEPYRQIVYCWPTTKVNMKKAKMVSMVIILVLFTTQCSTNKNEKKFNPQHLALLGLSLVFLTNCSSINRSQTGAVLGATTTTAGCVSLGVSQAPIWWRYLCVIGTFGKAEIMYNSDYDVHNAVFVDHLNNGPQGQSYTNWYNGKTGNSGIIKVTRSYIEYESIKCKDYDGTIDITNQ